MGSLMAGWDSPVRDPKAVTYQRNKSFTKEEIDAYWKTKKKIEEEHLKAISGSPYGNSSSSSSSGQKSIVKEEESGGVKLQRSSSLPLAYTKDRHMENISETESLEKFLLKNGWWTRSNWAHLNEPPVIGPEGGSRRYVSQFHVAGLSDSKATPGAGITA